MTLSDPLLKELKGHIAKLVLGSNPPYGDENETVFLLCHCIESIFLKGLIRHDGFRPWRTDCFSWFYQLVRKYHRVVPLTFKLAFEEVLNDPKTRTQAGKMRLLIRTCLKKRCLHIPIQFHVENQDYDDRNLRVNYHGQSIMGHEILSQIFLSLIQQLSHYEFRFDLLNSSFLDESWQIPEVVKAEFVPVCDKLGLTLGFPMGFAVIVDIIAYSLAAEVSDTVAVGDIMDEFNGIAVRNFYGSKIESLFRKNRSKPFTITFIKATDSKGQIYLPAIKLYKILGLDPEKLSYSKVSDTNTHPDEIDLELSSYNDDERAGDIIESSKLLNPPLESKTISQDLLQEPDATQSTTRYQSIMDELVLSDDLHLPTLRTNDPSLAATASDLIDIDLNSPAEIDWESLGQPETCTESINAALLEQGQEDNLKTPIQGSNSVFQAKYVDDANPFTV
ncbi:uncharacterized protein LOC110846705 [Folsomia candida]|uniref:RUN domain-containing protein n=1 Tax=Folsomia candida TaxID=158441 RepID=A0A226ELK4_FOLCA|nr:uncharacterized protein LOC110846705 [Folsomia candida]OXA58573.1 hypothetical protein Fcan01_07256 [Folsomia candida]